MIVKVSEKGHIELKTTDGEAEDFVSIVEKIVNGAVLASNPDHIFVVQINNWFGDRWTGFSGKILGALGIRRRETTIPPFHPSRVVSQSNFSFDVNSRRINEAAEEPHLHIHQESYRNFPRLIERSYPNAAFFWISGNSRINGKGSLLSYLPTEDDHWLWYLNFESDALRIVKYVNISQQDLDQFLSVPTPYP